MARQPTEPELTTISFRGVDILCDGEFSRPLLAKFLATAVAPEATWQIFDDPPQAVRLAAEHLAGRHGVDPERVQRCFERIVQQACGGVLPRGFSLFPLFATGPLAWPRRVFGCKVIHNPLGFLADEDLGALPTRIAVTDVLTDPRTPLYSHRELGRLLADFVAHQESTKDRLLRDGHATTAFARSPWLDVWLNKLYPIKMPIRYTLSSHPRSSGEPDSRYFEGRR